MLCRCLSYLHFIIYHVCDGVCSHDSCLCYMYVCSICCRLEWNSWQGGTPSPVQFLAQHQRRSRKLSGPGARDYRGEVRHICTMQCNAMRCITIKIILFSVCSSCILLLIYIYTHRVNLILQLTRCLLCMSNV
jgi:hypothetical protein